MSYETEKYRGCTIKVENDEVAGNPRKEWDNLGTIVMREGGDERGPNVNYFQELPGAVAREKGPIVYLNIRRYEHGEVGFKTYAPGEVPTSYPWNCPWDSGWAGIIYVTRERLRKEYGCKRVTPAIAKLAKDILASEVETYAAWCNGEVYAYVTEDPQGNVIDACGGYYGNDLEYAKQCAKDSIDAWHKQTQTPELFTQV